MLNRILVATDFSPAADAAWDFAVDLAATHHAELLLVHVAMPLPSLASRRAKRDHQRAMANALRLVTERTQRTMSRRPVAKGVVATGDAAHVIATTAQSEHVDLVILGGHPPRDQGDIIIGSVAERVVRSAHCAVLLVKAEARRAA